MTIVVIIVIIVVFLQYMYSAWMLFLGEHDMFRVSSFRYRYYSLTLCLYGIKVAY